MENNFKTMLWSQFGAAIDMMKYALQATPDDMWLHRAGAKDLSQYWYIGYHALFWLDLYLTGSAEGFQPPAPYDLSELDPAGIMPERAYSKAELLIYLGYCREKCRASLMGLEDEQAQQLCRFPWGEISYLELQLYNMRHVQEHAAQLAWILGRQTGYEPNWVKTAAG